MDVNNPALDPAPGAVTARLDAISANIALLLERQQRSEQRVSDLYAEFAPIAREAMSVGVARLADAEQAGYFRAAKAVGSAIDRVVQTHSPEELDGLADDLVRILDTLRALTRHDVLAVAAEAAGAVNSPVAPLGALGLIRASGDAEVQQGLTVLLEVLRHVGRAANAVGHAQGPRQPAPAPPGRAREWSRPAPARSPTPGAHPGLAALAPRLRHRGAPTQPSTASAPQPPLASQPAKPSTRSAPTCAAPADGSAFVADWTHEVGLARAAEAGITMTPAHQALVDFARREWLDAGVSPNIRRLSLGANVTTRDIYTLFPKAPGRTIARIAGIPKPAGCL